MKDVKDWTKRENIWQLYTYLIGEIIFLNKNSIFFFKLIYIFVLIEKLYENCNFNFLSLSLSLETKFTIKIILKRI